MRKAQKNETKCDYEFQQKLKSAVTKTKVFGERRKVAALPQPHKSKLLNKQLLKKTTLRKV